MKPNYAVIINFKLKSTNNVVADSLVKTARDVGARAVSCLDADTAWQKACIKYTIKLVKAEAGLNLTPENAIDSMMQAKQKDLPVIINITVAENGQIEESDQKLLTTINNWMHIFGHAFNDGQSCKLELDHDGFVLANRYAPYQKYLFFKSPLPETVTVTRLSQEPNRIEMIQDRLEPKFSYQNEQLTIQLPKGDDNFAWQVIRIQEHRPEDDITETKF